MNDYSSKILDVDINNILPNRFQPRIQFDENEILELSDSIKEHGLIQPIVVRPIGDKYEIIAGERRYKASVLAGLDSVPVIIKNLDDKESAEVALIENIQRKNLSPIEEALSYKRILELSNLTQENLALKLGKSQPLIANKIRLLNLCDEVQDALLENKISERHARSLLKLNDSKIQSLMLDKIINERLTVRKTDEEIDKYLKKDIEENKEEGLNMNNNFFGLTEMSNLPQSTNQSGVSTQTLQSQNSDIFANANTQQVGVNDLDKTSTPSVPNFDIFAPVSAPVAQETPKDTAQPQNSNIFANANTQQVEANDLDKTPIPSVPNFDIFAPVSAPVAQETPKDTVQPQNFDIFAKLNEVPQPTETLASSQPFATPIASDPSVPNFELPTMPIIESNNKLEENVQSVPKLEVPIENNVQIPPTTASAQSTPIIITDYNKQYDPVMPEVNVTPKVDFKEVINIIRECSNKIEALGFKIDADEYDLANMYQVVFKIEK